MGPHVSDCALGPTLFALLFYLYDTLLALLKTYLITFTQTTINFIILLSTYPLTILIGVFKTPHRPTLNNDHRPILTPSQTSFLSECSHLV